MMPPDESARECRHHINESTIRGTLTLDAEVEGESRIRYPNSLAAVTFLLS